MPSSSNSNPSHSSGDFPIVIRATAVGFEQATQKVIRFSDAIKQSGSVITSALNPINQFQTVMANLGRNFAPMNQGFAQAANASKQFKNSLDGTINSVRTGQTTLNQFMNTQRQTAQTAQQAATAEKTLTTSTMQLNNTFRQTTTTLGQAQGQFMNLNNNMRQTSQSMNNAIANTVRYNSEMKETAGSTMMAGSAADQSSSSHSKLGDVLGGVTRTMTGTIMSTTMLGMSIQEAGGMSEMLAAQQAKVDEQTQILADTIKQYGAESKEAAKEQKELNDMTRGLSYTQRNANMAMGDAVFFIIMLSSSLGNKLIPALANWSETTKKLSSGWDKFTDIISLMPSKLRGVTTAMGLTTAATVVQTGALTTAGAAATRNAVQMGALSTAQVTTTGTSGLLSTALGFLTGAATVAANAFRALWIAITGPIGLLVIGVITAITTAVALLRDNTFGVRDSLNALGVKLGEMVPALKGPLDLIKGMAGALGLSGENTEEWSAALQRSFKETRASMDPFFDALEKGLNVLEFFFQSAVKGGAELVEGFKKWAAEGITFLTDINTWKNAWNGLVSSASEAANQAWTAITNFFTGVGNIAFKNTIFSGFVALAAEAGLRAWHALTGAFGGLADWFTNDVVEPISASIQENIVKPLADSMPKKDQNVENEQQRALRLQTNKAKLGTLENSPKTSVAVFDKFKNVQDVQEGVDVIGQTPQISKPAPQTSADRSQLNSPGPATTFFGMDVEKARQDILTAANNPEGAGTKLRGAVGDMITPSNTGNGSGDAITKQKTALEELVAAQDEATDSGAAFLKSQTNLSPSILNNKTALTSMARSLDPVVEGNDKLSQTLDDNALALKNNVLQGQLYEKGQLEQRKVLQDMQMQIEENNGSLQEYAKQVEDGTITNAAFTLGQQEQRKALLDSQVEVANTNGMLQEYALQLESGKIQSVAFVKGQQEITKQFMDTQVETSNLNGQYSELSKRMNDTTTAQIMFTNGMAQGKVETAQAIIQIDQLRGSYEGTRQVLIDQAQALGLTTNAHKLSNEALTAFIETAKGAPAALADLSNWFNQLGDSILSGLVDALNEGKDDLEDAIDDIEETMNMDFSNEIELQFDVAAQVGKLKSDLETQLGGLNILWRVRNLTPEGGQAIKDFADGMMDSLKEEMDGKSPAIQQSMQNIINSLQGILDKPLSPTAMVNALNSIRTEMQTLGMDTSLVDGYIAKLGNTANSAASGVGSLGTAMSNSTTVTSQFGTVTVSAGVGLGTMATNTQQLAQNAAAADPELQKMITSIERLNTIDSAATQIFTVNIPGYVVITAQAIESNMLVAEVKAIEILNTIDSTATQVFVTNIPTYPVNVANAVDEQFGKAADDGINLMTALDTSVSQSFDNMAGYPSVVSEAVDQEFGKAADDGKNLIQALERAVKSSCDAMASAFEKVAGAVDKIGESAKNAESDVDSLKKAVESLPNIDRKITYHIETVGSKPKGAQFGTNMLVDKPQMLLVGEGFGKERVKVSPGTMPFAEDFTREMNHKFEVQRSVSGQPGQPGTNANGTSTNNGTSISTPGQPGANGTPGANGQPAGISGGGVNNIYAPGSQGVPTNQSNNPDLGGSSGSSMMISNNASLIQMNNSNGKRMIVDGKTGTVIMLDGSSNSSNNSNNNSGGSSSSSSNNGDIVGQNNNVNVDNDTNSKSNVYIPGSSGLTQSQSNSQSGSSGGQNYYYQSQTNNGQTKVNTNIPAPPGMINESAASSGNMPVSGSYSSDSRSRLLSRGDPFGFQTRIVHETPVEVNIDLEGVKLAKKILKILTEEFGFGAGYYG